MSEEREDWRDEWSAEEPPVDFADRVMARVGADVPGAPVAPRARRARGVVGIASGLALAAGIALAIGWHGARRLDHGEAIVADRTQVAIGGRAVAVLEAGSHVAWTGDDVVQSTGDVFYRVEPGSAFRVHTPAGDVQVLGTCFRVRVTGTEAGMNGRDMKAGVVGAALTAAALVSVYEGRVALSHANARVTVTAGESARADESGVRVGSEGATSHASGDDPFVAANASLADSVRDYKRQLDAIEAQKAATEKQLADAQRKLAGVLPGAGDAPPREKFDLSQDDWKELAKNGEVRARFPCGGPDTWNVSPKAMADIGLPPEDRQSVHDAYQQSAARVWAVIRPLCAQALDGDAAMADKLGFGPCQGLIGDAAMKTEDTSEEMRKVAEIRAGLIPMPTDPKVLGSYGAMYYALSGELKAIEQQLTPSLGPDDTRRLIYGNDSNLCGGSWGVGPRPPVAPGTMVITGTSGQGP